jgi:hypothetical protein
MTDVASDVLSRFIRDTSQLPWSAAVGQPLQPYVSAQLKRVS